MSIYCGRELSAADIQTIQRLMQQDPCLKRSPLSRKLCELCELWGWTKPNGDLKDMTCRLALARMQAAGLITLPPSQITVTRGRAALPPPCGPELSTSGLSQRPVLQRDAAPAADRSTGLRPTILG